MRDKIEQAVLAAIRGCMDEGELPMAELVDPSVERPRDASFGDWATSAALKLSGKLGMKPRAIAAPIAKRLESEPIIESVEIAGPGFINMRLSAEALRSVLADIHEQGSAYGSCNLGDGQKVQIEFVSSNPTGPMHVGHGRWASLGDSLANILEHAGYVPEREFYINDAGNQMDKFAASVDIRYMQICKLVDEGSSCEEAAEALVADTALPEEERRYSAQLGPDSYGGAYIVDIAHEIYLDEGAGWASRDIATRESYFKERSYQQVLAHVKEVLESAGVHFDVWFSERSLYVAGDDGKNAIERAIGRLADEGYIYKKDGAVWFESTKFGDDKDRVLKKADGSYTYFAPDIAYHLDKFSRGYDKVIDIWGADHHGYVARMQAAMQALGHGGQLDVIIGQLVNLLRDGVPVKISKRSGTMVTFEELLDWVGRDATRYLMILRSSDQQLDFDIEAAKKQDASNPVYYVQYAHARICSILRKAAGVDEAPDGIDALAASLVSSDADLSLLEDPAELDLCRKLSEMGEVVEAAARDYAPYRLAHYAEELASSFHQFYTRCQVLSDDPGITAARLYLANATRVVLAELLSLLGVSAPEKM